MSNNLSSRKKYKLTSWEILFTLELRYLIGHRYSSKKDSVGVI